MMIPNPGLGAGMRLNFFSLRTINRASAPTVPLETERNPMKIIGAYGLLALALILAGCESDSGSGVIPRGEGTILMCGRSVMAGWMDYLGDDVGGRAPVYGGLETPPGIVGSFSAQVAANPEARIAFFKLCFEDFAGGDRDTATANLERNKSYVEQAYAVCAGAGVGMIVGNALPQVSDYTDGDLVWNHRQYNAFLADFAASHANCWVFDFYGTLAGPGGSLKGSYASGSEDSHPNGAAYRALSGKLRDLFE